MANVKIYATANFSPLLAVAYRQVPPLTRGWWFQSEPFADWRRVSGFVAWVLRRYWLYEGQRVVRID